MKNLFRILFVCCFYSCGSNVNVVKELKNCQHSKFYDQSEICLPEVEGLSECSENPQISKRLGFQVVKNNIILGVYFPDSTLEKIEKYDVDQNAAKPLFGYFKLWGNRELSVQDFNEYEFRQLSKQFINSIRIEDSFVLKLQITLSGLSLFPLLGEVSSSLEINSFFSEPVQLENYTNSKNSTTIVYLVNHPTQLGLLVLGTLNILKIDNKVIFYSYYQDYLNETSVADAKKQNDKFGREILKSNGS